MRDYGKVSPRFWTGESGRAMRGKPNVQVVAMYLITAPGANMIGLFYLPMVLIAHETGMSETEAKGALDTLSRLGVAHYDHHQEIVWVPEMARHQIDDELRGGDKRKGGVLRELEPFLRHPFAADFLAKYGEAFQVPEAFAKRASATPSKGLQDSAQPLRSQDQDQDQDQEQEQEQDQDQSQSSPRPSERSSGTPIGELAFPCDGPVQSWWVTQEQLAEWETLFPALAILAECRKALAWVKANPTKRKTARGMPAFLVNWFGRNQNSGGGSRASPAYQTPDIRTGHHRAEVTARPSGEIKL
jgi:hypothetical protein